MKVNFIKRLSVLLLCYSLCSCASTSKYSDTSYIAQDEIMSNEDASYQDAINLAENNKIQKAIEAFNGIKDVYPFSISAMKSTIMAGYYSYIDRDYKGAENNAKEYLELYPEGECSLYARYLDVMAGYAGLPKEGRDEVLSERVMEAANSFIFAFPRSQYVSQVKQVVISLNERAIREQLEIGDFYFRRGYYLAALARYEEINNKFNIDDDLGFYIKSKIAITKQALGISKKS